MAKSYQELINQALDKLSGESAKLEAEILLAHSLKKPRSHLLAWPEKTTTPTQATKFFNLIKRRAAGEPVAYILGKQEFWGLDFKVTPATLIPRADTETLIETVLELAKHPYPHKKPLQILDLGTGSGAIAISLKSSLLQVGVLENIEVVATDLSAEALKIAQENAQTNKTSIKFYQGSWFAPLPSEVKFDFIVSNPPYIEEDDEHLVDLKYEPISALTAPNKGLADLETIISQAQSWLNPQGWLVVEHGYNQAEQVADIFNKNNFQQVQLKYDLGKNPRVTLGQKPL